MAKQSNKGMKTLRLTPKASPSISSACVLLTARIHV